MTQKLALQDRNPVAFVAALALSAILSSCSSPVPADEVSDQTPAAEPEPLPPAPSQAMTPTIKEFVEKERTIAAPFGAVRIRQYGIDRAAHAQGGRLHITYFDQDGEQSADYPKAVVMGSWGRMGDWSVEDSYSDLPVIVAKGGGTWQGYTCSWTSLTELQPSGPVELLVLQTSYSNGGTWQEPEDFEGTIGAPASDGSFVVSFTGTKEQTTQYRREGDAYTLVSGDELDGC